MSRPTDAKLRERVFLTARIMAGTYIIGVLGYRLIGGEQHSWLDAIYMTANALTTAGFREAVEISDSPSGLIFTTLMLIFGAATLVYFTTVLTAYVVEGDLTQRFRRRRMQRTISEMNGHYIVCGAGATGLAVLRELVSTGRSAVVIEAEDEVAARLEVEFPTVPTLKGDFTDDEVLAAAGIGRAAGVVICTADDKNALVATVTSRQMNPRARVVARAAGTRAITRLKQGRR